MKKLIALFVVIALIPVLAGANVQKMPQITGKKGVRILLFNGGRPWACKNLVALMVKSGLRVMSLDSIYLDGLGGAPIRSHMASKFEPDPFDGITPAFKQLFAYKMLIFNNIPAKFQAQLFTPERIDALKKYVEKGGKIIFTMNAPDSLGELLPVFIDGGIIRKKHIATRPATGNFKYFPENIPVPEYRNVSAAPDADVLSVLNDPAGTPFVATRKIGKGSVMFFNNNMIVDVDSAALKRFPGWGYANAFYIALIAECGGFADIDIEGNIEKLPPIPERKVLDKVNVKVDMPALGVTEYPDAPVVSGWTAQFANYKLLVDPDGSVQISRTGEKNAMIRKFNIPVVQYASGGATFNAATAEGSASDDNIKAADIKWRFDDLTVKDNAAVLTYTAERSRMKWIFKSGRMVLDGRTFEGISESVSIEKCPLYLGGVRFESELDLPDPLFAHRHSCYAPPRGYGRFDMSGKTAANTATWTFFGTGQPFEMIVCANGVYMGAVDHPFSTAVQSLRDAGGKYIKNYRTMQLGRVFAPKTTAPYWHWFSEGPERPVHDYLAMLQFQRKNLRKKAGLQEIPVRPDISTAYVTRDERLALYKLAKAHGYRHFRITRAESSIDSIIGEEAMAMYKDVTDSGLDVHIWSAGSYTQGDTGWLYKTHPEWFVRTPKGKIYCYGGVDCPVIDVNNEEFYKWYCQILAKAIKDGGVRGVYRDMDGTAARCVNYAVKESPEGLASQIKFYKFLQGQGASVMIEGQNPLVIDRFWYRAHLYTPNYAGNEFILAGANPGGDFYGGAAMDAFRTGMYGCFITFTASPVLLDIDKVPGMLERNKRAMKLAGPFNEVLDVVGMPYVRETPFGTSWISDKGGALFFWHGVKKLTVELPENYRIKGVEGNTLTDIKPDSIIILEKIR